MTMTMKIRDVMTPRTETIQSSESAALAAMTMQNAGVGCLPVVENDQLVGILTDRDIVVRIVAEDRDPKGTAVRDVMTPGCETVRTDANTADCARAMRDRRVHRMVVVDDKGHLAGIVSTGDLVQHDPAASTEALEGITAD